MGLPTLACLLIPFIGPIMPAICVGQLTDLLNSAFSSTVDGDAGFSDKDKAYMRVGQDFFQRFIMLTVRTDRL